MDNLKNITFVNNIIKNKIPVYFISPHFDDAVLSAGGLIAYLSNRTKVKIVNVFTKADTNLYSLSAKAFLKQCGFANNANKLFEEREKEDNRALSRVGIVAKNLNYSDALFRKKTNLNIIIKILSKIIPEFSLIYPVYRIHIAMGRISRHDDEIVKLISNVLIKLIDTNKPYVLFCPQAYKSHVDHRLVREVCIRNFKHVVLWSDFPYSLRARDNQLNNSSHESIIFTWNSNLDDKKKMILEYKSQIKAMFPDLIIPIIEETYYRPIEVISIMK